MIVKLLTEHHLECLSLKRGCRGSSESTHVKMPHCWKSHALAQILCFLCQAVKTKMKCHILNLIEKIHNCCHGNGIVITVKASS